MFKILKYLSSKEWLMIGVSFAFIVTQVWLDLKLPDYMNEITKIIQTSGAISDIWVAGGYMILCTLGSLVAAIIVGFFAARIGASFSQRLRSLLFNKVESFSMEEINRFSTSSLITRSTNDIIQVQMLIVIALQLVIKAPIMAVWAITKIAGKGYEWSMATAVAVLVILVMVSILMVFVIPKFKKMQTLTDNVTRVTRENLTGLRVVRAYNAEDYQGKKFEKANKELTDTQLFTNRAMAVMMPVLMTTLNVLALAIYWIGAYLVDAAQMLDKIDVFANMVTFSVYAMQVIMSFMMLVIIFIMWPRASVSAKRINEVLDTTPSIVDGKETQGKLGLIGDVVFNNVSFKYPDAADYVLEDISFTAKHGETVAFIGSTGSGKSTLINLIPRLFDVTKGEVLIDGVNVKDYNLEALYNKIGYVPQKAVLFKGTVESNVAYGDNSSVDGFSDDTVKKAIQIAQGTEFVEKMQDGYNAAISQGGANVSGGQKQRLAIARAVCRKPEIYIFDDSFSALDYKTDRVLRSKLKQETAGVTSLIVAQRIGTIMDADKIIVLDQGKIVGQGTHKELLRDCLVYKEIAMSQLSEEELTHE
ncbi:MAG: ABC transporter ATP-binding protein/permease [Candidatus Bathyarchaeota archaeon]|uniref:ABC transporter ATP-binding protein n=1 Tax=Candidatus Bathycorpusculum sp. TaxID=2994959 RepID=UPI00282496AD|nr:ABC transporter ATP-binding protein/permease [Candidatus Termiticorpusculum sp.]MCL2257281.1 ABC transporter ATP-binding protein/permease [Candidatus Termiticorpusculum sp.]MCL2292583.1 ABC transporter ATP-binding protein/permease [Candidatus Termiticorpusculum sp.]